MEDEKNNKFLSEAVKVFTELFKNNDKVFTYIGSTTSKYNNGYDDIYAKRLENIKKISKDY